MTELVSIDSRDPALASLLEAERLPTRDLPGDSKRYFGLRNAKGDLIAAGGLEICGSNAILRSCVVLPSQKGRGLGIRLINELIDTARRRRIRQLFLLTEAASGFFKKFGFREIARNSVPIEIAGSAQFAEICPQSAVAMALLLPDCPVSDCPESDCPESDPD